MDNFSSENVRHILHNKFVCIIGDSIQRGIYKDLVRLLQTDKLLLDRHLKMKGERSFLDDELIEGGSLGEMSNRKNYKEVRQYQKPHHLVRCYYVTRCYGRYVESILEDLRTGPTPDVVMMNSCLWDVSRYGPLKPAKEQYKLNLQYLCIRMKEVLPPQCLFMWNTTMPVGKRILGGFLIQDLRWMENHLSWQVKEANHFAVQVMEQYGVDVNDLHFHFRDPVRQYERRVKDGIHWDPIAHRSMSKITLMHICRAWDLPVFKIIGSQRRTAQTVGRVPRRMHQRAATQDGRVMSAPFSSSAVTKHNAPDPFACPTTVTPQAPTTTATSPFAHDVPLPDAFSASHDLPAQYPSNSLDSELSEVLEYLEAAIQRLYDTQHNNLPHNHDWQQNAGIQVVLEECTARLSYVNSLVKKNKSVCRNAMLYRRWLDVLYRLSHASGAAADGGPEVSNVRDRLLELSQLAYTFLQESNPQPPAPGQYNMQPPAPMDNAFQYAGGAGGVGCGYSGGGSGVGKYEWAPYEQHEQHGAARRQHRHPARHHKRCY